MDAAAPNPAKFEIAVVTKDDLGNVI
jgi:hypothetical protein